MKVKDHFLSQEIFELRDTAIAGVQKTYPVPADLGSYYDSEDYISHHQDSGSLKEKLYKFIQNINLKFKKSVLRDFVGNEKTVLDYGCGAGEFLKSIEADYKTIGYEPHEKARTAAQKKIKSTKIIDDLALVENDSLDAITLWHVFEHVEKQDELLSVFYSKLKTDGKLIIAVPNTSSYDALKYQQHWAAYDVPRHLFHFSKIGMQNKLKDSSWELIDIKPLMFDSFYISILSEKYKNSTLFWLKGLLAGTISNVKALKNGQYSSLIYIVGKK